MAMDHMCDSRQMVVLQSRLTVLYRTRPHQSRTQWPLTTPEHLNEHVSVRSSLYHATNQHDSTVTAPGSLTAWPEKAYELRSTAIFRLPRPVVASRALSKVIEIDDPTVSVYSDE
jgi:hypothetical protein